MATQIVTPSDPAAQPQSLEQLRDAAVAASAQPAAAAPAAPAAAPEDSPYELTQLPENAGYKLKLRTGEEFTDADPLKLLGKVATSKVHTTLWAKGQRDAPDDATAAALHLNQQPPAPPEPQAPQVDPAVFNQQFLNGLVTDPVSAVGLAVAKFLGYDDPETLRQDLGGMQSFTGELRGEVVAAKFMAQAPDFSNTKDNVEKLFKIQEQAGLPVTPEGLMMAHSYALKTGVYQPAAAPAPPQQKSPPPMSPAGTAAGASSNFDPNDLSQPDYERKLRLWAQGKL